MTRERPTPLCEVRPGAHMEKSNSDKQRGEKRGVLSTVRANELDKTKNADADAANDTDEEE